MREPNYSIPNGNKAAVGITPTLYDRRALDCTSDLPLIISLNNLAYLTASSPRIREILTVDGGIERLVTILKQGRTGDQLEIWKWNLAFQCVFNIGVRGTESVRTRVVEADIIPVVATILENWVQVYETKREKPERSEEKDKERSKTPTISSDSEISRPNPLRNAAFPIRAVSAQQVAVRSASGSSESRRPSSLNNSSGIAAGSVQELANRINQNMQTASSTTGQAPARRAVSSGVQPSSAATEHRHAVLSARLSSLIDSANVEQERQQTRHHHHHHHHVHQHGQHHHHHHHRHRSQDVRSTISRSNLAGESSRSGETPEGSQPRPRAIENLSIPPPPRLVDYLSQPASPTTPNNPVTRPMQIPLPEHQTRRASMRQDVPPSRESSNESGDRIMDVAPPEPVVDIRNNENENEAEMALEADDSVVAVVADPNPVPIMAVERQPATHRTSITAPTVNTAIPIPPPAISLTAPSPIFPPHHRRTHILDGLALPFYLQAALPREEDVLLSLHLLAYITKYISLRSHWEETHLVPRLKCTAKYKHFLSTRNLALHLDSLHLTRNATPANSRAPSPAPLNDFQQSSSSEVPEFPENTEEEYLLPSTVNLFPLIERFTPPTCGNEQNYWSGVVMRNFCRKDDTREGRRQCAYHACRKWEEYPRQFAKCRRCRRTKYCSKGCQKAAWGYHRHWCLSVELAHPGHREREERGTRRDEEGNEMERRDPQNSPAALLRRRDGHFGESRAVDVENEAENETEVDNDADNDVEVMAEDAREESEGLGLDADPQ